MTIEDLIRGLETISLKLTDEGQKHYIAFAIKMLKQYEEEGIKLLDIVRDTILGFIDGCDDDSEEAISEKDKLLLEVNKAIRLNMKSEIEKELKE